MSSPTDVAASKPQPSKRLSWSGAQDTLKTSQLVRYEVPIENYVSLPCPTLRHGRPAFVFFACEALRVPGSATRCAPPERTWAITALAARLISYAWAIDRQARGTPAALITLDPPAESMDAADRRLAVLRAIMDDATNDFFDGRPARHGADLLAAFKASAPPVLMPFYRDRAPDFFDWLDGRAPATASGGS